LVNVPCFGITISDYGLQSASKDKQEKTVEVTLLGYCNSQ